MRVNFTKSSKKVLSSVVNYVSFNVVTSKHYFILKCYGLTVIWIAFGYLKLTFLVFYFEVYFLECKAQKTSFRGIRCREYIKLQVSCVILKNDFVCLIFSLVLIQTKNKIFFFTNNLRLFYQFSEVFSINNKFMEKLLSHWITLSI